jgi:hypothetical protein
MVLLAFGDIVGTSGVEALASRLPALRKHYGAHLVVANAENADGSGIMPARVHKLRDAGADVLTLGNHTFRKRQIETELRENPRLLRPLNFSPRAPGKGYVVLDINGKRVCVVNLVGRCHMDFGSDNPFLAVEELLSRKEADRYIIDFHAQATSEKYAMAYHLDGRASVLFGTHTHVQTADEKIFPKGMGYLSDLGMCGPWDSVIGVRPEQSLAMFLGEPAGRFESAPGPACIQGAAFAINDATGYCTEIERIQE